MRKRRISTFILLLLSSALLFSFPAEAQTKKKGKDEKEYVKPAMFQGISVGIDLYGIGKKLIGNDTRHYEVSIETSLWNRFIPVVEMGYAEADALQESNAIHYTSKAPYVRIGCDYNMMYKKTHLPGYLFLGLRVGYSSFSYDVESPDMTDPVWGVTTPCKFLDNKCKAAWTECVAGLRTVLVKNVAMTLSVRYKNKMKVTQLVNTEPWFIPGYGKGTSSSSFGIVYSLSYKLPF